MKIFIHTMYYLPDFGSAPVLMDELARALAAAGHEVEVVTTLPRTRGEAFRGLFYSRRVEGGVVVKRLWTNASAHPLARLLAWNIYTAGALLNLLAVRRGDILFLRTPPLQLGVPAFFAKALGGARVVVNVQDIHPDLAIESGILRNPAAIRFAKALEKWVYGLADTVAVISDGFARNLRSKGVPDAQARGPAELGRHGLSDARAQGQPRFAPARPRPEVRRHVFGDDQHQQQPGPGADPRSGRAPRRGPRGRVRPRRRRDEEGFARGQGRRPSASRTPSSCPSCPTPSSPSLLASSDVLLVPLDRDKSDLSVPSKLYTFMAAGRPILGLASPGSEVAALLRENDCGLVAAPDDPAAIAAAVRALKGSPERRRAMGGRARDATPSAVSPRTPFFARMMLS